jgi:hypothetical protein
MSDGDGEFYTSLESLTIPYPYTKPKHGASEVSWEEPQALEEDTCIEFEREEVSSDAISSPASEAEEWKGRPDSPDLPPEYWQVQRLIKYIKVRK